jgi:hypothetical protein
MDVKFTRYTFKFMLFCTSGPLILYFSVSFVWFGLVRTQLILIWSGVNQTGMIWEFMVVQMRILSGGFLKDPFKLDTSSFGSLKELVQLEFFLYF